MRGLGIRPVEIGAGAIDKKTVPTKLGTAQLFSQVKAKYLLHLSYKVFKSFRVVHCKIRKHFAIKIDPFLIQFMDEL